MASTLDDLTLVIESLKTDHYESLKKLGSLQNTRECIEFAFEQHLFDNSFSIEEKYNGKDVKISETLRSEGNLLFKKKKFNDALHKYNHCIINAPFAETDAIGKFDNVQSLAFGFANRSAVLFHLQKNEQCLDDIACSIEAGYPESQCYKLWERAARCHQRLNQWSKAITAFNKSLEYLPKCILEEKTKKKWTATVNDEIRCCKKCEKSSAATDESISPGMPSISGAQHAVFPSASMLCKFERSEVAGRFVMAGDSISAGDVLFVEKPYASALLPAFYGSHCYFCHLPVDLPFPCQQCSSVIYCGKTCATSSWDYFHKIECKYLGVVSAPCKNRLGHVAFASVISAPQDALTVYNDPDPLLDVVHDSPYEDFRGLVSHEGERDIETKIEIIGMACYYAEILVAAGFIPKDDSEAKKILCCHLLLVFQIFMCNAMEVTEMVNFEDFNECSLQSIAVGTYPSVDKVNHSCDPSMEMTFYGNICIGRAIRDLAPGEEITFSYGPDYSLDHRARRQHHLWDKFLFRCTCTACVEKWPMFQDLESTCPVLKCQKCRASLLIPSDRSATTITCDKCSRKLPIMSTLEELSNSHQTYARAAAAAFEGDIELAIPILQQHLSCMQRLLRLPWKEFCSCQSTLKQCYRIQATKYSHGQKLLN